MPTSFIPPHPRAEELEDLGVEGILAFVTAEEIADAWCGHHLIYWYDDEGQLRRRPDDADAPSANDPVAGDDVGPYWWAIDLFMDNDFYEADAQLVRRTLLALVDRAHPLGLCGHVGAGPMENFLSDDPDDLAWLASVAPDHRGIAESIAGAWVSFVSDETWAKLDELCGGRLMPK